GVRCAHAVRVVAPTSRPGTRRPPSRQRPQARADAPPGRLPRRDGVVRVHPRHRTGLIAASPSPLDGIRVLAAEQMQALPFATQLLARLGADGVKVEHPVHGESGRGSSPGMTDPEGRTVGATYLRNNLDKRSLGLDLKTPEGRDLFLALVPQ